VNATPLGMRGEAIPAAVLTGASGYFEMSYASGETPAMRAASTADLPVASGTEMLLGQAAASFHLWTGRDAPIDVMRAALDAEVARRATTG
jgi:shikimate dehydrogenase